MTFVIRDVAEWRQRVFGLDVQPAFELPGHTAAVRSPTAGVPVSPWEEEPAGSATRALGPVGEPLRRAADEGLVLSGISRSYGARTVLSGVDLALEPGARIALLGANGAGKTTILRLAAGIISTDAGEISLDGFSPESDRREYQRRLGFLSAGDRALYARLTVRQNLDFWARVCLIERQRIGHGVERAIDRFGLDELADRRADRLSMGQRQRVRLALTFLHEPRLVLLDEPRTSLDDTAVALLIGALDEIRSRGGSVIWAAPTGDPEPEGVDRVYLVEQGRLRQR